MVFYLTAEGWVSMTAERWVPHISLVFCEMWDTTTVTLQVLVLDGNFRLRFVVSQISQKTSEMWGTQDLFQTEIRPFALEPGKSNSRSLHYAALRSG